jgi:hypothetical protein
MYCRAERKAITCYMMFWHFRGITEWQVQRSPFRANGKRAHLAAHHCQFAQLEMSYFGSRTSRLSASSCVRLSGQLSNKMSDCLCEEMEKSWKGGGSSPVLVLCSITKLAWGNLGKPRKTLGQFIWCPELQPPMGLLSISRWCMSIKNYGGMMISTEETPDSSIRAFWQSYQQSFSSKQEEWAKRIRLRPYFVHTCKRCLHAVNLTTWGRRPYFHS